MRNVVMAACLLLLSPAAIAADTGKVCTLNLVSEMELVPGPDNIVSIPVTINGNKRQLMVDTGAFITSLTPNAVQTLGLPRSTTNTIVTDVLGHQSDILVLVHELRFGDLRAREAKYYQLPGRAVWSEDTNGGKTVPISGVLGPDYLMSYDVELDFANNRMRFFSKDHCEGKVVYWKASALAVVPFAIKNLSHIIFPLTLDGHEVRVLLDTGASDSFMQDEVAQLTYGIRRPANADPETINGQMVYHIYHHTFASLGVDGLTMTNVPVSIMPTMSDQHLHEDEQWYEGAWLRDEDDLILGMNELKHLHIFISYSEHKLYLTPAEAPQTAASATPDPAHP